MVVFHNYLNCKCKIFIQNAELLAPVAQNWHNFFRRIIEMAENRRKQQKSMSLSLTIAKDIPREAVAEFSEEGDEFPGINISVQPVRQYKQGTLASHILGYASKIGSEEYQKKKDEYNQNDIIGKTGIEAVFEKYLKGKNGTKQIDMAVDGTITAEVVEKEAVAGSNVVLTIDSQLQKIAEEALKDNIEKISKQQEIQVGTGNFLEN